MTTEIEIPFVSVIIPTFRDFDKLLVCLKALGEQTYPLKCFEIIVVNNDAHTKIPILDVCKNLRVIEEPKPGSYAARNKGISIAVGEIIAFTDSDCIPDSNWLNEAVSVLTKGADRVAGNVELIYQSEELTIAELYEKAFSFRQKENAKNGVSVTANLVTWRRVIDEVGSFDETSFSGGDIQWCKRASSVGFGIEFCKSATVKHPARSTLDQLLSKRRRVVGGMWQRRKNLSFFEIAKFLLKGVVPPVRTAMILRQRKDLTFIEQCKVFFVRYYIKLYGTFNILSLILKLRSYSRN